ncbi:MAG TPA: CinA family protein [Candidatus Limnocylindrales bacterium]
MDSEPLAKLVERLQALCLERGVVLATAESCTGGLVAKLITDLAGSSGYFRGGVVSYSNEIKTSLLDVPEEQLAAHGAVSAQVARSMAMGARARMNTDFAVAVTGVAGPGGGSAAKPVGLTYVAVADAAGAEVRRLVWSGDRLANRESTVRAALELLIERVSSGGQG